MPRLGVRIERPIARTAHLHFQKIRGGGMKRGDRWSICGFGLSIVIGLFAAPAAAQTTVATTSPPRGVAPELNQQYKIGIADVVIIRVFGHPELSREAPVSSSGNIRLPFFDEIPAVCLTETELAEVIAVKLRKYLRDPQVDVIIKEYRSQPVAVMGAVTHPGRVQLQRRVRILELLSYAGGPAPNAGSTLFIIHDTDKTSCDKAVAAPAADASSAVTPANAAGTAAGPVDPEVKAILSTFKLRDLLVGSPEANRFVEPGDIISIPEADQIFITGSVVRPGALPLRSNLTLLNAISMAGGFGPEASRKNVRLIRHDPNSSTRTELVLNVDDIEKRRAEDVMLQPNDVVTVQSSAVKNLKKSFMQIIPATVSALPLVVLP
jgi:polysaccharide export outer membrane protein